MKPKDFWELTPAEFAIIADGYIRVAQTQAKEKAKNIISLAWYTEALARTKELPKLKGLLEKLDAPDEPKQPQTQDQMMAMCKLLNAAYGGTVIET